MKTRKDYEQLIKQNLQGVVWRRLQNALLGKELISFGGVVNELQSAQYDNFIKALSPEQADYAGLAVLGLNQFVVYDIIKPAIAQFEITPVSDIKPYQAVFKVGTNKFYSNEFYSIGSKVVMSLYRGEFYNTSYSRDGQNFDDGVVYVSGVYQNDLFTYLKLPENTLVDTLRVSLVDSEGKEYPQSFEFIPGQENNVRVFRALDNTVNVAVKSLEGYVDIYCRYIVGSEAAPDSNEGTLTYNGNEVKMTASISVGVNSIEAARESFIKHIGMVSSVSTKEQIIQFVKEFPQVKDCMPELTEPNQVTVWVKPANPRSLDPIQEALTVYGELAIMWRVLLGTPVPFGVLITQIDYSLTSEQKAEIVTLINSWIDENMKYSTVITPAWLLQAIMQYSASVSLSVTLKQKIEASVLSLLAVPIETTIAIVDEQGIESGWDSRGYIRSYADEDKIANLSADVRILQKVLDNYLIAYKNSEGNWQAAMVNDSKQGVLIKQDMWDITGLVLSEVKANQVFQSSEYLFVKGEKEGKLRFKLFSIDQRFAQQQNSLIKDPEQNVSWTYPSAGEWVDGSAVDGVALVIGSDIYNIRPNQSNAYLTVARYTLSADTLLYQKVTDLTVQAMTQAPYVVSAYCISQWGDAIIVAIALNDYSVSETKASKVGIYYYSRDILTVQSVNTDQVNLVLESKVGTKEIKGLQVVNNQLVLRVESDEEPEKSAYLRMRFDIIGSASSRYATGEIPEEFISASDSSRLLLMGDLWSDDNHSVYDKDGKLVLSTEDEVQWMTNVGLVDYTRKQITLNVDKYISYFTKSYLAYQTTRVELERIRNYPALEGGIVWK